MISGQENSQAYKWKIALLCLFVTGCFAFLCHFFWSIQVNKGGFYEASLTKQSMRRVRVPGLRGMIYDRNGVRIADNDPSYSISVYLEELRQPGATARTVDYVYSMITNMADYFQLPVEVDKKDIKNHMHRRLPLPFVVWKDIDQKTIARWAERPEPFPGVDLFVDAQRVYPEGDLASHVVGYVGRAAKKDRIDDEFGDEIHYYVPEMVGRSGIEKRFDSILRGEAGGRLVRVDVSGYKYEETAERQPKSGADIQLTIDAGIQRLAQQVMKDVTGSVVVMDPHNGDVLAMVSSPGFDPNDFVPYIPATVWNALRDDPRTPLLNRAAAGAYAPGSIFKPVVALAGLEAGAIDGSETFHCPGYFKLGRSVFHCWYRPGHGDVNVREALMHSCNVFFFKLAQRGGYDIIYHMAEALGLGRKTGIELDYERGGLLPDDYWKREHYNQPWTQGDTCNLSIGQGSLLVTPLQMAVMACALANGGTVFKPNIIHGIRMPEDRRFTPVEATVVNQMNWKPENLALVRGGMYDVVMHPKGTGRKAGVEGISIAGKTGTAEYGRKGSGLKYGWMIAFAPFDNPEYAVALVVDKAVSGGTTAAPLMHDLMYGIFYGASTNNRSSGKSS